VNEFKKVYLLGASFDTGNMGVSALAESSIKCILQRWPKAQITIYGGSRVGGRHLLNLNGKDVLIEKRALRFCKNIFLSNHFIVLFLYAVLLRLIPAKSFRKFCANRNENVRDIIEVDIVADITGGDSFSDLYGMRRFYFGFLIKWLMLMFRKPLVLLPQTYGPFNKKITRILAKHIIVNCKKVYSRDKQGLDQLKKLSGKSYRDDKILMTADLGFVLDPAEVTGSDIDWINKQKSQNKTVVGINVSGLLYNGGYTGDNMFGLEFDYRKGIKEIVEYFMINTNASIVLIPHVIPGKGYEMESDPDACRDVYNCLDSKFKSRVLLIENKYSHSETKYIISKTDFFIGSRMHACIAAMSQCVPAIGLAYSRKFQGVFDSVEMGQCVIDARTCDIDTVLNKVKGLFSDAEKTKNQLHEIMPPIKEKILNVFGIIQVN
jgi:polysaccharide pyruvyl transferase WcaK-like protein